MLDRLMKRINLMSNLQSICPSIYHFGPGYGTPMAVKHYSHLSKVILFLSSPVEMCSIQIGHLAHSISLSHTLSE